ncbi:hypothetical protein HLRTI_002885 [Halorhabdus tiamatea SARL4B]|uniref:Uncharacterized protein n=1 Tax=Halorhabdus tiamatea SARL4B TaxID=1033806 RepID=U2DZ72_9EURY|nr:hypothetical protein [Halorhabdus tiamatea]ERJ05086.1 hypothetical protein HLRTI_002885 [Halorhabdus tiamatea SARL4B]
MSRSGCQPGPDETLTDILSDDEAVDEMPAERVKEAWVKMKLYEVAKESYLEPRYGRQSMDNDDHDRLMEFFEDWGPQGVQTALKVYAGEAYDQGFVAEHNQRVMGENEAKAAISDVFDAITNTDLREETRVAAIREKLKSALRSCGMPRPKIARATVQNWKAERATA